MFKNVASQKIALFAFDYSTGAPKTGDAANITAYVNKDWAGVNVLGDTSASEIDSTNAKGWYLFDLTQAESNADLLLFTAKSSTSNVTVVGRDIQTVPANFGAFVINSSGVGNSNLVNIAGSAVSTGSAQLGVNVVQINAVAASSVTTVNANVGTTQPVNFTGTGGSALAKSDMVDIAGAVVATSSAQLGVNVVNFGGASGSFASGIPSVNAGQVNGDATAAANLAKGALAIANCTVFGSPTTTSIPTSACSPSGAVADQFKGRTIIFSRATTTTALRGQASDITANTSSSTPTFTVTALTTAPQVGDTFDIY